MHGRVFFSYSVCNIHTHPANINDRSMLGDRDTEIAVRIQDQTYIDGRMNGQPYKVGSFSHELRCFLFRYTMFCLFVLAYWMSNSTRDNQFPQHDQPSEIFFSHFYFSRCVFFSLQNIQFLCFHHKIHSNYSGTVGMSSQLLCNIAHICVVHFTSLLTKLSLPPFNHSYRQDQLA